ncbi:hypothetical protein OHB05_00200 [Streptomyces sp. NBC_00638]|uniref:hypothetical protein n=1 Tax=unclassified Streptomyces TaxID=2593676 RepID=UPI00224C9645|nr:hypothetical protein [Streptomyces sp. NBC_00638]MCX5001053.1 hypothetical protein [Streptomyces sp. NBC_00638]
MDEVEQDVHLDVAPVGFGLDQLELVAGWAATLAPYGVLGLAYCALAAAGAVTMRKGDFPTSGDALLVSWLGMIAFAVYGVALAVAARSYWLRTRPISQVPVDAE